MRRWQLWLGVTVSALFLWLALRGLRLDDVWTNVRSANFLWLIPSVATYFTAVWARTWRWDYMLRPLKRISLRALFPVVVIGYMGNNIYPFRAGEVLRSYVLRQREDVPMAGSLATVIVERVFDGLVMLVFVFAALPFAPLPSDDLRLMVIIASAAFFGALALFFALATAPKSVMKVTKRVTDRLLPAQVGEPVLGFAGRFLAGLESLRSFRNVIMIFITSLFIWLLETVKYWFIMQAFDFQVSFFALMLMNGIVNLATTMPSAPGYIGTFDGPGIAVLVLYGVRDSVATAYTLVLHAALWLPITLLGVFYMLREGLGWADFGRAVKSAKGEGSA